MPRKKTTKDLKKELIELIKSEKIKVNEKGIAELFEYWIIAEIKATDTFKLLWMSDLTLFCALEAEYHIPFKKLLAARKVSGKYLREKYNEGVLSENVPEKVIRTIFLENMNRVIKVLKD